MNTIPADEIVSVAASVLSAGGTALDLNGVILTDNPRLPTGNPLSFASTSDVASYFGATATETNLAAAYFSGFNTSTKKPGSLYFARYSLAPSAAFLRGGPVGIALSLTQLHTVIGSLIITVDGTAHTANVDLSTATSFSNAAALLATALTEVVVFDAISQAFVVTSGTTGANSTISFGSGPVAASLLLSSATGAVVSQGEVVSDAATQMTFVADQISDWCSFTTAFEPDVTTKEAFATWNNGRNNRYLYVPWDTDPSVITQNASGSLGSYLLLSQASGTAPVYYDPLHAVALMGFIASIDFTRTNGRVTMAVLAQDGLIPSVSNRQISRNLKANGYNFYGAYATANDKFTFAYPGQVSGKYKYIDSYINQIWLTNQFQLALMVLLTNAGSIPYNQDGYDLILASCGDVIEQAINFGAIRRGVTLSRAQAAEINNQAGGPIDRIVSYQGYFIQVKDALPQVRAARGSPPFTFWYTDGESVQSLNLASIQVQ